MCFYDKHRASSKFLILGLDKNNILKVCDNSIKGEIPGG